MKFVIDRSTWRCGGDKKPSKKGRGDTRLLNKQGFMCCLGSCALQVGADKTSIKNFYLPKDTKLVLPVLTKEENNGDWKFVKDSKLSYTAVCINDRDDISQKEREHKLKMLFKRNHHELVFRGKFATKS